MITCGLGSRRLGQYPGRQALTTARLVHRASSSAGGFVFHRPRLDRSADGRGERRKASFPPFTLVRGTTSWAPVRYLFVTGAPASVVSGIGEVEGGRRSQPVSLTDRGAPGMVEGRAQRRERDVCTS